MNKKRTAIARTIKGQRRKILIDLFPAIIVFEYNILKILSYVGTTIAIGGDTEKYIRILTLMAAISGAAIIEFFYTFIKKCIENWKEWND